MTDYTKAQNDRLDREAAGLLSEPQIGMTIRWACGATTCSRRTRGRALHGLLAKVRAEPVLVEILCRAVAQAWRERLYRLGLEDEATAEDLLGADDGDDVRHELTAIDIKGERS